MPIIRRSLDDEKLAWPVDAQAGELDYPGLFAAAAPSVVRALRGAADILALYAEGLPTSLD